MAKYTYEVLLEKEYEEVYGYIEKNKWLIEFPDYLAHKELEEHNELVFQGDFGMIKKPVKLKLKKVQDLFYEIESSSDPIVGSSKFLVEKVEGKTKLSFELELKATGFMSSMINSILDKAVPDYAKKLLDKVKEKI